MENEKIKELNKAIRTLKEHFESYAVGCPRCPFKDYKCTFKNNTPDMWKELEEQYEITLLEREMLKRFKTVGYSYVARDSSGDVYIYNNKPDKFETYWSNGSCDNSLYDFDDLFQFVQWEDEEPTKIGDVLNNHVIIDEKK